MSDSEKPQIAPTQVLKPITIQTAQPDKSQGQVAQIQNTINSLLQGASTFPVRYQPAPELLENESGRVSLSIVRARLERDWDVKAINAKLSEDSARSLYWIISPKKALDPVKVKKDWEDDDFDLDDLLKPMKF